MIKLSLQNTWAHKRRLIGTFMAVLIGVGFLSGTLILGDTLRANFTRLFDAGYSGTDVLIRPEKPKDSNDDIAQASRVLDAATLIPKIEAVDGVRAAVARTTTYGQLIGKDGEAIGGNGPPTFAASWNPDTGISPYNLTKGTVPSGPDEVVIDAESAKDGKLKVGDTATLLMSAAPLQVKIVGIAQFGDGSSAVGVTYAFFSESGVAAHLTATPGTANDIVVAADQGISQTELRDRIRPLIGTGNEALTGTAAAAEAVDDINAEFLGFLTSFLVAFAGIALFVATFSIYNTFSIIIAQRSRESALMRAIGATRRQVMNATMVEAIVIGVTASVVGLAAGLGVAAGLKGVFDAFGLGLPAGGLTLKASSAIVGIVVGIVVTVVAAVVPARRGSRVAPIEALRSSAVEVAVPLRRRGIIGVIFAVLGIATLIGAVTAKPDYEMQIACVGAGLILIGMLVLGPVIARPVAGLIGAPLARLGGVTGELSRENAVRNPRRTASTAAALLVGVAIVVLFSVFISSTKNLVTQSVNKTFGGDLVIAGQGPGGGAPLPEALAGDAAKLPGINSAVGLTGGPLTIKGDANTEQVAAADIVPITKLLDLDIVDGSAAAMNDGTIAISEDYAKDEKLAVGDSLTVTFPDKATARLRVAMVYANADIIGPVFIQRAEYRRHAQLFGDFIVFIGLDEGTSMSAGRHELKALTDPIGKPKIQDRAQYTESVGGALDQLLGIVIVMLALAILIAVMGIANTLSLSVYERTRELGVLRAVGTTRQQVRRLVRWESVIVSTFGTVGGVGLGAGLGWALVQAAFSDSKTNPFALPVGQLVMILVLGIVVGVLASARPAYRAAKMEVLGAVSAT